MIIWLFGLNNVILRSSLFFLSVYRDYYTKMRLPELKISKKVLAILAANVLKFRSSFRTFINGFEKNYLVI